MISAMEECTVKKQKQNTIKGRKSIMGLNSTDCYRITQQKTDEQQRLTHKQIMEEYYDI